MILIKLAVRILAGIYVDKEMLRRMVDEADTDGNGQISLDEVLYFILKRGAGTVVKGKAVK